jgi:hypothetical protein
MNLQLFTAMRKIIFLFSAAFLVLVTSCQTITTSKVLDTEMFEFMHGGKVISLPVDLVEIKISKRRGKLFSGRDVTYEYVYALKSPQQRTLMRYQCTEDSEIDWFISQLEVKKSKDRSHFAIGIGNKTAAIFDVFKNNFFVSYSKFLDGNNKIYSFKTLNLNQLKSPRRAILDHLSGYHELKGLDDKVLVDILCSVSPDDELNSEASYMLIDKDLNNLSAANEDRIIEHCRKSTKWRKNIVLTMSQSRDDIPVESYIRWMEKLVGRSGVDQEDKYRLKEFLQTGDVDYFSTRLNFGDYPVSMAVKKEFKSTLEEMVYNVCSLPESGQEDMMGKIELLKDLGEYDAFDNFLEGYKKSSCIKQTIHEFNNSFMFLSNLSSSETRKWVDFVYQNFDKIEPNNRSWDYDRIEEDLSCNQKRALLTHFKSDIDIFDDMVIPICN